MANLVVIEWGDAYLLAACDDDGAQLTADLGKVLPGKVHLAYLWKGGGQCLKGLQQMSSHSHMGNGWFRTALWHLRHYVQEMPQSRRCAEEHPGLHPSAGVAMTALRAAAGPDQPDVGNKLLENQGTIMPIKEPMWGPYHRSTPFCDCTEDLAQQPPA